MITIIIGFITFPLIGSMIGGNIGFVIGLLIAFIQIPLHKFSSMTDGEQTQAVENFNDKVQASTEKDLARVERMKQTNERHKQAIKNFFTRKKHS